MASKHARDQKLVTRVAERLAAQDDQPIWSDLSGPDQMVYLSRAIGLLDLVDEKMPERLVLCAHCPRLVPATSKKCACDWPACAACAACAKSRHKKARRSK